MRPLFCSAVALLAVAALAPEPAAGAVECGVRAGDPEGPVGDVLAVTTSQAADGVAVSRAGAEIRVSDDRLGQEVACSGGPPLVDTVDSVAISTAQAEAFAYLDLSGGGFAPGAGGEAESEPEIEFAIEWPTGFLGVGGGRQADVLSFGRRDGEIVGQLNADADPDVDANALDNLLLRGKGGDDTLSAAGLTRPELPRQDQPVAPLRSFASLEGGPGKDNLTGGAREDLVAGGGGDDLILVDGGRRDEVDCGAGRDEAFAGRRDKVRRCERVVR
jgi:hypothetical protein